MARTIWYEPLLAFLAEQPPETVRVTLTFAELEALADGSLPSGAAGRSYWRQTNPRGMGTRLKVVGWRLQRWQREPVPLLTFERVPPDMSG